MQVERDKLELESIKYLLKREKDSKEKFEHRIESYIENKKSISKPSYYAVLLSQYQGFKSRFN